MFVNKNITKKFISGIILSCLIFIPAMHLANEHENAQEKKQTKYGMAKNLIKGIVQGYGTYLGGSVVHEFGHWLTGKLIYKCNGFFYVYPGGSGITYFYYDPTNKDIIKELLKRGYIKNYQPKLRLNSPEKCHPLEKAAGPLFGIGYNLLVQRMALQSCINNKDLNRLWGAFGAYLSLTNNIYSFSPFVTHSDGNGILQYFNKNYSPHKLADIGFQALAVSAALMLGIWNIKAVLPATAT